MYVLWKLDQFPERDKNKYGKNWEHTCNLLFSNVSRSKFYIAWKLIPVFLFLV